jgi:hypothetical protein
MLPHLPEDVWRRIYDFMDITTYDDFILSSPKLRYREQDFHAIFTRHIAVLHGDLLRRQGPNVYVLLFIVGMYHHNPRMVQKLNHATYLTRFRRFIGDIPSLMVCNDGDVSAPALLQRIIKKYQIFVDA